jgi:hypothetical protein
MNKQASIDRMKKRDSSGKKEKETFANFQSPEKKTNLITNHLNYMVQSNGYEFSKTPSP